ncbi:hypothetical protein VTK73DRAFT_1229 [Phialemonium thermophilum]|uniref:DUF1746 domain-containing protein n=1 Tax=Phialemonium thermophilum TaxID=223376 RepID=A0ABR3Y4R2_9PEZI
MNNVSSLNSSAGEFSSNPAGGNRARIGGNEPSVAQEPVQDVGGQLSSSSSESSASRKTGMVKKLQFMTHLMRNLDMVVFAEICSLYYMECSFPRLLLRVIPHYFFLTPKSEDFLLLLPAHRSHVFAIFIPNILCIFLHMVGTLPRAGEATRGYLHGGVIVDFIGQKPPTSKLAFLLVDLMIMGVQCVMLAVHQERELLRKLILPARRGSTSASTTAPVPSTQDIDAEERGVLRDASIPHDETADMEMRPPSEARSWTVGESQEGNGLLERTSSRRAVAPDLTSVMRSGNAILGNFHIIQTVRMAGSNSDRITTDSLQTIGYTATLAAMAAERRARLEAQRRQR